MLTGKLHVKLETQAKALQRFIAVLMQPPMEHELPDVELSPREIKVLMLLGDKGEMIMTDLAAALPAPLSTVTRIIDRLQTKQLVERFRSADDRRIVIVKDSDKGKLLRDRVRRSQLEMAARILQPLSNREREILLGLFEKLTNGRKARKA